MSKKWKEVGWKGGVWEHWSEEDSHEDERQGHDRRASGSNGDGWKGREGWGDRDGWKDWGISCFSSPKDDPKTILLHTGH